MVARLAFAIGFGTAFAAWLASRRDAPGQAGSFIEKAIEGNLAEIEVGRLAADRGSGSAARAMGEALVADHSEANEKAIQAALALGLRPPSEPGVRHKALHARLSRLHGPAFDRAFAEAMVLEHRRDVRAYERAAAGDDAVAAYAREVVPKLRGHLAAAERLRAEQAWVH